MGVLRLLLICTAAIVLCAGAAFAIWIFRPPPGSVKPPPAVAAQGLATPVPVAPGKPPSAPAPGPVAADCTVGPAEAASDNAVSLGARAWSPWGRPEKGWEIYAPLVAHEIATACAPTSPGFAAALAVWQMAHRLPADGALTPETFEAMRVAWLRRRPFVAAFAKGTCPPAADEAGLASALKDEGYSGKQVSLRPAALAAYRALVRAARAEVDEAAADRRLLTIFSGYRAPADDAARCDLEQTCGSVARARCSAHRTGLAVDLFVGAAPGSQPESTDDANRLHQSRTATYRWLVANAGRFGFAPYPFEPWHWEWTGEPVAPAT